MTYQAPGTPKPGRDVSQANGASRGLQEEPRSKEVTRALRVSLKPTVGAGETGGTPRLCSRRRPSHRPSRPTWVTQGDGLTKSQLTTGLIVPPPPTHTIPATLG